LFCFSGEIFCYKEDKRFSIRMSCLDSVYREKKLLSSYNLNETIQFHQFEIVRCALCRTQSAVSHWCIKNIDWQRYFIAVNGREFFFSLFLSDCCLVSMTMQKSENI
jgi:hypothetical protein